MRRFIVFLVCLTREVCLGGLLGAGTGHGSCAAFPFRSDFVDHIGGCPRYAECCTEFGYCHGKESWEEGYFRDCNGVSNGQPLPGSVIRIEAEQAASSQLEASTLDSPYPVTAQVLGISEAIWQKEISRAVAFLSKSSSSSTLTTSSLSSTSSGGIQGVAQRPKPSGVFPSSQTQTSEFSQSSQTSGLSSTSGLTSTSGSSSTLGTSSTSGLSSSGSSSTSGSSLTSGSFSSSLSSQSIISQILLQLQPQIENAVRVVISSQPTTSGFTTTGQTSGSGFSTTGQTSGSGFSTTGQISTTGQTSGSGFSTTGQNSGFSTTGQNSGFSTSSQQTPLFINFPSSGISTSSQTSSSSDLVALILAELTPLIANQVSQAINP